MATIALWAALQDAADRARAEALASARAERRPLLFVVHDTA